MFLEFLPSGKHSSGKAALSQAGVCGAGKSPPKLEKSQEKLLGGHRIIGHCTGHRSVMHWHTAPHQLVLHVLWEELSSDWFSSRRTPGFGKGSKRKSGLYSWRGAAISW